MGRRRLIACLAVALLVIGCTTTQTGDGETVVIPPPEGSLKYSIAVAKFKNEAGWAGQWSIGDGFATIMTDALQQSGWFIVLGDQEMRGFATEEQDFAESGRAARGKKAPKIGRMTPAQLLVRGSITHVQETGGGSGGVSFRGVSLGGSRASAEVNMTIYLVDSATGRLMGSTKVTGTSRAKGVSFGYHGSGLGGLTGGMKMPGLF